MSGDACSLFVGIDIAARSSSVAWATSPRDVGETFDISQTPEGFDRLQRCLLEQVESPKQVLVVMEATGTYWMQLGMALHEAGFIVSVINPASAHYFARSLLKRSKTDQLDAQTIAQLAATREPKLWTPPPDIYIELQQRLQQRADLRDSRTRALNRLHALRHHPRAVESVVHRLEELAAFLQAQIDEIDRELAEELHQDAEWYTSAQYLMSVNGIGLITAAWLLMITRNFTTCEEVGQLTSFVGLAPHVRQSGSSLNGRGYVGQTGNAELRKALYMAALNAMRFNPIIQAFYERLVERGKPCKVALCACARKLVHICWAVATKQQMFDPLYQQRDRIPA